MKPTEPTLTRLDAPAHGMVYGVEQTRLGERDATAASNARTDNAKFEGLYGFTTLEDRGKTLPIRGLHFRRSPGPNYIERRFVAAGGQLLVDGIPAVMGE